MKASNYILPTTKEDPSDAVVASHKLMVRAGLIRKSASGLYHYLPLGLRVLKKIENIESKESSITVLIIQTFIIGIIIGLVGAGGGFLIIPSLVLFAKLPIKKAVGTSLFIIAMNSLIGFIGDVQNIAIDWIFLLTFTSISIVGILILYICFLARMVKRAILGS